MSADKQIADKNIVEQFLADEVIQRALKGVHDQYYEEFRAAVSADKRMEAWAKARALDDLAKSLRAVVDIGKSALANQARAERAATKSR